MGVFTLSGKRKIISTETFWAKAKNVDHLTFYHKHLLISALVQLPYLAGEKSIPQERKSYSSGWRIPTETGFHNARR